MIPLLAAIVLAGAAGAGPVLVSDACGTDSTDSEHNRCAIEAVDKRMKSRPRPKELKVESEGKLYSLPDDVEMVFPSEGRKWWQLPALMKPANKHTPIFDRKFPETVVCVEELWLSILKWAKRESSRKDTHSDSGETEGRENHCCSPQVQKEASFSSSMGGTGGENLCQICFESEHSTAVLPCGHGGMCWDCSLQIFAMTEECPMCRSKIELVVQLDINSRRRVGEDEFVSVISS